MYLGRAYLEIQAEIDSQGFPLPRLITLESGRRLEVMGVMERSAVSTAAGVSAFRYELWIGDTAYIVYLDNALPLRWYVDVKLPFKAVPEELPAFAARPAAQAAD